MKKIFLTVALSVITVATTACGTISPTVQTPTETTVTELSEPVTEITVPTMAATEASEETVVNTFIAEFFDSNIIFTDVQKLVSESMKNSSFEHQKESSNGIEKITLKSPNGGGIVSVMSIDMSQSSLNYGIEYILENFGNYYFNLTTAQMNGITEDDFVTDYRMVTSMASKGKHQRYSSVQKTDGMAAQFGYTETYAVISDKKLSVISGAFLSTDMMDRHSFIQLMAKFAENIEY